MKDAKQNGCQCSNTISDTIHVTEIILKTALFFELTSNWKDTDEAIDRQKYFSKSGFR